MVKSSIHLYNKLVNTIFILILTFVLSASESFDTFNWKLYDIIVTHHRILPEHRDNVVFICIDQKSIDIISKEYASSWPWPREYHGRIVDYLVKSGVRAIVFDVIFSEQDIDRDELSGTFNDRILARAIKSSGNTFLAVAGDNSGFMREDTQPNSRFFLDETNTFSKLENISTYQSALYPIDGLASVSKGLGLVNIDPENDGIHRRYPLISKIGDSYAPSLALAVVQDILSTEELDKNILDRVGITDYIDSEGKFLLNWYGNGGVGRENQDSDAVFRYFSYVSVLKSSHDMEAGIHPLVKPDEFLDKIVIIGSNAAGLLDLKATPFTHLRIYPGMEIHATAIENMLTKDYIRHTNKYVLWAAMALIAFLLYAIDRISHSLQLFIGSFVILMMIELFAAYNFITVLRRWTSFADILGMTVFVFVGLVISGYFHETKEKRLLKRSFGRYVNETVLNEIISNPTVVNYRGRTIRATIMVTDIAGFTSISEKLPPDKVVTCLNDYLSAVSGVLIDNDAYINKYIGDAILALFGAFGEPNHERTACIAAIKARDVVLRKVEEAKLYGNVLMNTRFGITTGEMTMGNIGSDRKLEYTVLGDTVNTAFRFEGLNKYYRTTIIVGDRTKASAGEDFEFRQLDIIKVKGKETPEVVYELLGIKGEVPFKILRIRDEFERAAGMYRESCFAEAMKIFSQLSQDGDETSEVFKNRCQQFLIEEPPPDWNGVWVMKRK